MQSNDYLNTEQAADYTGLSKSYLAKLRCLGGSSRFCKIGKRVLYRRSDLDDWLASQIRSNTSEA